ncbi:hypothetical protein EES39_40770 [Streptomyces sp. ADI92-24]|nr:hypothetical protein EES39_40770 [Streptomyces sp. ADI92-24]
MRLLDWPPRLMTALSFFQHRSPTLAVVLLSLVSSVHEMYWRSMYPGSIDQPSPMLLAWLFVEAVRPSTDCEE